MRHTIRHNGEVQVVANLTGYDGCEVIATEAGKPETVSGDHVFDEAAGKWSKDTKRAVARKRRDDRRSGRTDRELLEEALDRIDAIESRIDNAGEKV